MPTYEYECQDCKCRFEVFQNMSDAPLDTCIKCKGKVKRLIGAGSGIIFKGSGFYVTDYKKSPAVTNGSGESGQKTESTAGEKPKAETSSSGASSSTVSKDS